MNSLLPNQTIIAGEGRGLCLPCSVGDFCPQGTSVTPSDDISSALSDLSFIENPNGGERSPRLEEASKLLCPRGSYCPTPKEAIPCDPGYFCPQGSIRQETCSIPRLLLDNPTVRFQFVETQVMVQELRKGEQIIQGNICPAGSASPSSRCPAGSFCPSVNVTEPCPRGYYCPEASTSPNRCPWLSYCPAGSKSTGYSWGGFVIGAVIIVVLAAIIILISVLSRGEASEVEAHVKVQERLHGLIAALDVPQSKFPTFKQQQRITIEFTDLRLTIKKDVTILNGITGKFKHSQMVAIMGGSGCGKTTFLNVLCGKANYGKQSGKVSINTHEVPLQLIRSIKGFVPQDDTVHEDLTVQENLHFSASVRLPDSYDHKRRLSVVRDTCELLQLMHIMNSVVGSVEKRGISGGQRKRVNIGVELVAQPSLLFLDEPTSGLDSTSSQAVLNGLKLLSHRGMSSIMVIHQPRYTIFELFDQVLLLAAGGNQVFLGPSSLVLPYFESKGFRLPPNENPAHFFLDVIHEKVDCATDPDFNVEKLFDMWKESGEEWVAQNSESPSSPHSVARVTHTSRRARAAMKRALNAKFTEMDDDGNDYLTPVEMREFVIALGHECEMGDAQEIITIMTDGRSYQQVTRDEFINYCLDQDFFSGLLSQMATRTMRRTASLNVDNSLPPDFSLASADISKVFQNPIPEVLAAQPDTMERPGDGESFELPEPRSLRNPLRQFIIVFHRSAKKYQRSWVTRIIDIISVIAVAVIIGGIQGTNWTLTRAGVNFFLYLLALGVLVTTGTLRVFGKTKVVHWREASSGYNVLSAFLGMVVFDLLDVTLRPLLFSTVYWSLTASSVQWSYMFAVSWMCSWYCSGMAYILSTVLPEDNMTLAGASIPLVMAGFLNGYNPTLRSFGAYSPMHFITYISYARWGVEMLMVAYFSSSEIQFRLPALALMQNVGFCNYVFQEDPGPAPPPALNSTSQLSESQLDTSSELVVAYAAETFPELYRDQDVSVAEAMDEFAARCQELAVQAEPDTSCNELLVFYKETTGYQQCWHA
eukprot:CAMPEP_0177794034 /NCGR_PEP_ID=MMETSP0491_2-20121128/25415_1 /TAXON_ID=63592 /ORGANISM="Tetraselmis chuii, Strain PLY429" /LENGTH=1042 /DNA_ID=CAMNT_0019316633 /DNA_START=464 /DNA_END=3588 /DNA_ORIENTATION=-